MTISRFQINVVGLLCVLAVPFFGGVSLVWAEEAALPLEPLVIGTIRFDRRDVFDTGSEWDKIPPYTWGNAFHIVTKERTIRTRLLFSEGDPYDPELIAESERVLRQRPIFRYVTVTAREPLNGKVDIDIHTEDVWTTSVQMAYGTAGGHDLYRLGLIERNLLGNDMTLGGHISRDLDNLSRSLVFHDPYLWKSQWSFLGRYKTNEQGRSYKLELERPFRSVWDATAGGVGVDVGDGDEHLYENGDEVATFHHGVREVRSSLAKAVNPQGERVFRWSVSHHYKEDIFFDQAAVWIMPLPEDRTQSALLVACEVQRLQYRKERGVLTFDRDEDINLGWEWVAQAGPSLEIVGASRDALIAKGQVKKNWVRRDKQFLFSMLRVRGRVEEGRLQNGMMKINAHCLWKDWWWEQTAVLNAEVQGSRNLDPEVQFRVGGASGLRGYSVRQFCGTKMLRLTLENRRVVLYDWFQLINWGWAVFADTGMAWKENERPSLGDLKSDVGAGFRFAPSRSTAPGLIRVDLAYALNDNNRHSRWVTNIGLEYIFGPNAGEKLKW